jgi:hypothetical protein
LGGSAREFGCEAAFLRRYIELQFRDGMAWDNWGLIWQLDHRDPLAGFNLADRAQFLEANHYSNLRPLLISEHAAKLAADLQIIQERRNYDSCRTIQKP